MEESHVKNIKKFRHTPKKKKQNESDDGYTGSESDKEGPSSSSRKRKNVGAPEIENLVHKCVYYLLVADQKKYAIKKADIIKHVLKDYPKQYGVVIDKANIILKETYGMELMELENQKGNLMLINILRQELDVQQYSHLPGVKKQQQGLILYLLLIIYMNENSISESDLWKAMAPLGIKLSTQKLHPIFGDVQKYINSELVKQMYIDYVCISKDPPQYEYRWGLRAKEEVDKLDLLHFACLVMDDKRPEEWLLQYKDATEVATETPDST